MRYSIGDRAYEIIKDWDENGRTIYDIADDAVICDISEKKVWANDGATYFVVKEFMNTWFVSREAAEEKIIDFRLSSLTYPF